MSSSAIYFKVHFKFKKHFCNPTISIIYLNYKVNISDMDILDGSTRKPDMNSLNNLLRKLSFEKRTSKSYAQKFFHTWKDYSTIQCMKRKLRANEKVCPIAYELNSYFINYMVLKKQRVSEAKSKILNISYNILGAILVIGFFLFVAYYNYLMFERYLVPVYVL